MSNIKLVDTHCHIHDPEFAGKYEESAEQIISDAKKSGVNKMICVGTSLKSSDMAVKFSANHPDVYAALAIHPDQAKDYSDEELKEQVSGLEKLLSKDRKANGKKSNIVAIGECGLDYFYHNDLKTHAIQKKLLLRHIELAQKYNIPLIFHIRSAKEDVDNDVSKAFLELFKIVDGYKNVRGVVHSFSSGVGELEGVISRGLYVGLNGIMTFTRDEKQLEAAKAAPLDKIVLETDAPFLTPKPFRGKMCKPQHTRVTAEFLSKLRSESLEELAKQTSQNADKLFSIGER